MLAEGNFLKFSETKPTLPIVHISVPQEEYETLRQDNALLKAQSKVLAERAAFTDDVIAEIAIVFISDSAPIDMASSWRRLLYRK